ncbi:hypothetical protein IQ272_01900 [Chroococcidiopsidales cyanobacterium LEGE 13417]|uniref:hypothetical protein n=1 Tax=Chroococcidiopsis sp. CCALA 051 TaxID=869949 RepID=UPI0011B23CE4|nr:hypothetical protein [Chroococcidiopsis sp. CCALA 051]MBE9014923.1 hypothetical protein [Chroococcidiopsidales cyanobacterium LEGE 13417]
MRLRDKRAEGAEEAEEVKRAEEQGSRGATTNYQFPTPHTLHPTPYSSRITHHAPLITDN